MVAGPDEHLTSVSRTARGGPAYSSGALISEWLLIDQECIVAEQGLMGVSGGKVWDTTGTLVATGPLSCAVCKTRNDRRVVFLS
jgi:hypothetical protein